MRIIDWQEFFMYSAKLAAKRSKDPNTQVGAVIENENKIVSIGYNGMPKGDDTFPWANVGNSPEETKYPYVVHAEINAILNLIIRPKSFNIYSTLFPCSNCAKFLVQAGAKEVFYNSDKYSDTEDAKIAKKIFDKTGVKYSYLETKNISI